MQIEVQIQVQIEVQIQVQSQVQSQVQIGSRFCRSFWDVFSDALVIKIWLRRIIC